VGSYNDFFAGSATIAGALVGLLFVSLSIQPERNLDRHRIEHRAIAGTAFTALIDALFVSLIGLQPGAGLQYGAIVFGAFGLLASGNLGVKLWNNRKQVQLSRRWSTFMGFILIVYAAQLISGLVPMSRIDEANRATTFIYIMFALGIARAWELLGMSSTGMLHQLRGALVHPDPGTPPSPAAPPNLPNPPGPADPPSSR
jgi:hypothetical protein